METKLKYHSSAKMAPKFKQTRKNRNSPQLSLKTFIEKNRELENRLTNIEANFIELESKLFEASSRTGYAELKAGRADVRMAEAERSTGETETRVIRLEEKWMRITRIIKIPLRAVRFVFRIIKRLIMGLKKYLKFFFYTQPKKILKYIFNLILNSINSRPRIKRKIVFLLNRFPSLKNKLKKKIMTQNLASQTIYQKNRYDNPSPRTLSIYLNLKTAIAQQKDNKECV